jgi:large subunit ribosomal protein L21
MEAVIATGGKQARVQVGQRLAVERLGAVVGAEVTVRPVLVIEDDRATVLAGPELSGAEVRIRVLEGVRGPKVRGFTYKPKTRKRRRFGHRQRYDLVEVTEIRLPGARVEAPAAGDEGEPRGGEGDGPGGAAFDPGAGAGAQ